MIIKKRFPFIAFLLSAFFPSLGQLYNGQIQKGGLFMLLFLGTGFLYFSPLPRHLSGLMAIISKVRYESR